MSKAVAATGQSAGMKRRGTPSLHRAGRRTRRALSLAFLLLAALIACTYFSAESNIDLDQWKTKRVLVVTAHPDDEVMFFSPTILTLISLGVDVSAVCLSLGNADGLGEIRGKELMESYSALGVPSSNVDIVDDARLQDGMRSDWDVEVIIQYIEAASSQRGPFDAVVTFDSHGVSQHVNHRACYLAVKALSETSLKQSNHAQHFALLSLPIYVKFLSFPMALIRRLLHTGNTHNIYFHSSFDQYLTAVGAMRKHRSQLVWFRYLYITTSTYMYNNELVKL